MARKSSRQTGNGTDVVLAMDSTSCLSADEVATLISSIEVHRQKVTSSKEEARDFLKRAGIACGNSRNARK